MLNGNLNGLSLGVTEPLWQLVDLDGLSLGGYRLNLNILLLHLHRCRLTSCLLICLRVNLLLCIFANHANILGLSVLQLYYYLRLRILSQWSVLNFSIWEFLCALKLDCLGYTINFNDLGLHVCLNWLFLNLLFQFILASYSSLRYLDGYSLNMSWYIFQSIVFILWFVLYFDIVCLNVSFVSFWLDLNLKSLIYHF